MTYIMAESRALAQGGLWHYVRAYGKDDTAAKLNLAEDCIRRRWELDQQNIRTSEQVKGEPLRVR